MKCNWPKNISKAIIFCYPVFCYPLYANACDFFISSVPIIISTPGKWCLAKDLNSSNLNLDAIIIQTNNVVIDGNGFILRGPTNQETLARGIIAYNKENISIQNITISGFHTAILFASTNLLKTLKTKIAKDYDNSAVSKNIHINKVNIINAGLQGIHIRANDFSITNSHIFNIGPTIVTPHAFATGICVTGSHGIIANNYLQLGNPTGNGENVGIGFYNGEACEITNNTILFDHWPKWGRNFGIWTSPISSTLLKVNNNIIYGAHYGLGPFGLFKGNSVINVSCSLFVTRLDPLFDHIDLGNNQAFPRIPELDSMSGEGACPDNIEYALNRYHSEPGEFSAYSMAIAWGESGTDFLKETFAWFIVAAHWGHVLAKDIVDNPPSEYTKEIIIAANKMAEDTINSSGSMEQ